MSVCKRLEGRAQTDSHAGPVAASLPAPAAEAAACATDVVSALLVHGTAHPQRVYCALRVEGREDILTYGDLLEDSLAWAAIYRAQGVDAGSVVLIFLPTSRSMYGAFFGAMLIGAVPSFMPCPSPKQDEDLYSRSHRVLLKRIRPAAVVGQDGFVRHLREMLRDADLAIPLLSPDRLPAPLNLTEVRLPAPDDLALLQHSSGTTGLKKGVMLTHEAITRQLQTYAGALQASADDVIASWLPVYHDMGLIACTLLPLMIGARVVVLDPFEWSADPDSLLAAIESHAATLLWLPNFAFEHLVRAVRPDSAYDLRSVRAWINCSEWCRAGSFDRFLARYADCGVRAESLQVCYAMAETVFAVSQTSLHIPARRLRVAVQALREAGCVRGATDGEPALELLSAGPALEGFDIRIESDSGVRLPDGQIGEIVITGGTLFQGYHGQPELTQARLCEGRYRTRDRGFLWAGELYVIGRTDDVIIVHGRNYYAHEIEQLLGDVQGVHPGRVLAIAVDNADAGSQDVVVLYESPLAADQSVSVRRAIKAKVQQDMGLTLRDARRVPPGWLIKTTSGKWCRASNQARYLTERQQSFQGEPA